MMELFFTPHSFFGLLIEILQSHLQPSLSGHLHDFRVSITYPYFDYHHRTMYYALSYVVLCCIMHWLLLCYIFVSSCKLRLSRFIVLCRGIVVVLVLVQSSGLSQREVDSYDGAILDRSTISFSRSIHHYYDFDLGDIYQFESDDGQPTEHTCRARGYPS